MSLKRMLVGKVIVLTQRFNRPVSVAQSLLLLFYRWEQIHRWIVEWTVYKKATRLCFRWRCYRGFISRWELGLKSQAREIALIDQVESNENILTIEAFIQNGQDWPMNYPEWPIFVFMWEPHKSPNCPEPVKIWHK